MRSSLARTLSFTLLAAASHVFSAQQPPPATPPSDTSVQQPSPPPASPAPASTPPATTSGQPPSTAAQPAKNPDGTYTIRQTTRLVVLDTVVTDAKGNIVRDLKREDFHVEEANEPQNILNFTQAGANALPSNLTINSTAELDQLAPRAPVNIILLDEFNTRFEDMAFARYSLKKFLEKQPDKLDTPTMLIAVDLQHFTVLHDYTQDKAAVITALDHHFVAFPWQVHQYAWISERYGTAFLTLRRVAEAVIGHPGHKNMIWIGRGFPPYNFINAPIDSQTRVNNAVQDCVNILRDARVTLYTVDPAGILIDPGIYGSAAAFNDPFGGNYQFSKLAKATGGRTLYGRNDVDAEIGTAIRDGSSFYTLTYRPGNTSTDPQKFRKIRVTLPEHPGFTALTREGYYLQYGPGRVNPQNPSRRLVSDLLSADASKMVYDGVPLTLAQSTTDPDAFTVHVDGRGLAWTYATDTEPRHAEIILVVSTFDKKDKELKRVGKNIRVSAPTTVPPAGRLERSVDINYKLDHDPKAVRARFVIRVAASGRIGTADTTLGPQAATIKPPQANTDSSAETNHP